MDFFQAQERARRRTGLLLLLFIAGIAGMIIVLYAMLSVMFGSDSGGISAPTADQRVIAGVAVNTGLLLDVTIGVLALVSIGTIYKALTLLSAGGQKIAVSMGGRLVLPDTRNPDERRLLNVIGEMAIAAGAPQPAVYLLPDEHINAFAAGTMPHNAVIGVTRGALRQLNRAQLQGVMAHEFSHIMNGDMRLNMRLIAVIHGIMLLGYLGYFIRMSAFASSFSRSSRGSSSAYMLFLGLALSVAGYLGTFFGSCIRAAISRQREYLADAAAVQYTRDPNGIAGALEYILLTTMRGGAAKKKDSDSSSRLVEYTHMMFSEPTLSAFANPLASHPPLPDRIQRILPDWDLEKRPVIEDTAVAAGFAPGTADVASGVTGVAPGSTGAAGAAGAASVEGVVGAAGLAGAAGFSAFSGTGSAAAVVSQIGQINAASLTRAAAIMESIPLELHAATENSYSARALIYLLLLDEKNVALRQQQLEFIEANADTGVYELTLELTAAVDDLPPAVRLPLVQRALPALRLLSPQQYHRFLENIGELIKIDSTIEFFEWCLQAVIVHDLYDYFNDKRRYYHAGDKQAAMRYALSLLARIGQQDAAAAFAAAVQAADWPLTYSEEAFQPQQLFDAMQTIATLPPKQKSRFIRAAVACAEHSGRVTDDEAALLRAYFMLLDCPLPLVCTAADAAGTHPPA